MVWKFPHQPPPPPSTTTTTSRPWPRWGTSPNFGAGLGVWGQLRIQSPGAAPWWRIMIFGRGKDLWRWFVCFHKNTPLMIYIYIHTSICLLMLVIWLSIDTNIMYNIRHDAFYWSWSISNFGEQHLWISPRSSGRISSSHVTVPCFNKIKSFFLETSLKGEVFGGW